MQEEKASNDQWMRALRHRYLDGDLAQIVDAWTWIDEGWKQPDKQKGERIERTEPFQGQKPTFQCILCKKFQGQACLFLFDYQMWGQKLARRTQNQDEAKSGKKMARGEQIERTSWSGGWRMFNFLLKSSDSLAEAIGPRCEEKVHELQVNEDKDMNPLKERDEQNQRKKTIKVGWCFPFSAANSLCEQTVGEIPQCRPPCFAFRDINLFDDFSFPSSIFINWCYRRNLSSQTPCFFKH